MTEYEVVARPTPALARIRRTAADGTEDVTLWGRIKTRHEHRCVVTGETIPAGAAAFRPMLNELYRYERISEGVLAG